MAQLKEHRIEGKTYNIKEAEKAVQMGVSPSWLQKDRMKDKPVVDFARVGPRMVRYSAD